MVARIVLSSLVLLVIVIGPCAGQQPFCGSCINGGVPPMIDWQLIASCTDAGARITSVLFASYGTPNQASNCQYSVGSCNAANSSAIVSAACIGASTCTIYPNTTTFGDPCFGTVKVLAVVLTCSSGSGSVVAASPAPPVSPPYTASVGVSWGSAGPALQITPSLQVVSQSRLWRDSPIHDASFASLHAIAPHHARLATWLPYPKYGVAELDPPSGALLCGPAMWALGQLNPFTLDCGVGATIAEIDFASFGTASGVCGAYTASPSCHDPASENVVKSKCLGKQSCVLAPSDFRALCASPYLAVQARCSDYPTPRHTYWNFTFLDEFVLDFWNAVDGETSAPIPSFSTQPTWLYSPDSFSYPDDPDRPWYGYDKGTAPAQNGTALGDYYGRLISWYSRGGFTDEYGQQHTSGHALNITIVEVFNEPDYEHGHTAQSYTTDFDSVVSGIRRWADPTQSIRFVGMNNPNIDDTAKVVEWATYFLNASNHAAGLADARNYIGYHSYPTFGNFTPDPNSLTGVFSYVDDFVGDKVPAVDAVIAALSPDTLTFLDETGCDMDQVLGSGPPPGNNPRYWVACGSMITYMFGRLATANTTVRQLGASQLMDAPGQEPSVTLLDWTSGNGTARYWSLALLLDVTAQGDTFVPTKIVVNGSSFPNTWSSSALYAQGFEHTESGKRTRMASQSRPAGSTIRTVLLVNKLNSEGTVSLVGAAESGDTCTAYIVDETTGLGAPRQQDCTQTLTVTLRPYANAAIEFTK